MKRGTRGDSKQYRVINVFAEVAQSLQRTVPVCHQDGTGESTPQSTHHVAVVTGSLAQGEGGGREERQRREDRDREGVLLNHSPTLSHSLTNTLTHSLTHPPTLSLTHSPTHSVTHSFTHPLTQSPTHSLTQSLTL